MDNSLEDCYYSTNGAEKFINLPGFYGKILAGEDLFKEIRNFINNLSKRTKFVSLGVIIIFEYTYCGFFVYIFLDMLFARSIFNLYQ